MGTFSSQKNECPPGSSHSNIYDSLCEGRISSCCCTASKSGLALCWLCCLMKNCFLRCGRTYSGWIFYQMNGMYGRHRLRILNIFANEVYFWSHKMLEFYPHTFKFHHKDQILVLYCGISTWQDIIESFLRDYFQWRSSFFPFFQQDSYKYHRPFCNPLTQTFYQQVISYQFPLYYNDLNYWKTLWKSWQWVW